MIHGLHIEPTNICTLKCSGCARTRFIEQWPTHWQNHSLNIDQLMAFIDVDLQDCKVKFCGNYGDPIYHPELIRMAEEFKKRGASLTIITNGSYKSKEWWCELTKVLDNQDTVCFSVDGTPENFTKYRVNADWNSIQEGMEICADSHVRTVWKYIPFSYNQHDIDTVHELSKKLGIDQFQIEPSDRFDAKTEFLKPDGTLLGSRYLAQSTWKQTNSGSIDAKCNNFQEHFISADGYYLPCCYLGDYRFYYKTEFGRNKNNYQINKTTLSQILNLPTTINFYKTLADHPGCQYNCPKLVDTNLT